MRVFERVLTVDAGHPAFAGHFPGDPLVPGVLLLDWVTLVARSLVGDQQLQGLPGVKFLSPLRPGDRLSIRVEEIDAERFRFVCRSEERLVAEGRLAFAPPRPLSRGAAPAAASEPAPAGRDDGQAACRRPCG